MENFFGIIIYFAVNALFLVWVFRDVKRRDGAFPIFWGFFVLVGGVIGLVLYLLLHRGTPPASHHEQ